MWRRMWHVRAAESSLACGESKQIALPSKDVAAAMSSGTQLTPYPTACATGDENIDAFIDQTMKDEESNEMGVLTGRQSPPSHGQSISPPKAMATLHEADVESTLFTATSCAIGVPAAAPGLSMLLPEAADEAATKVQAVQRGNKARKARSRGGVDCGLEVQGHHFQGDN